MFVPAMWNAISDPTGAHVYPALPSQETWPYGAAAYWSPLTHLLLYSFGWRSGSLRHTDRSTLGRALTELLDADLHYLPQDPRLGFMLDVWGEDELRDFAHWAKSEGGGAELDSGYGSWHSQAGYALAGGTDSLHLADHWGAPRQTVSGLPLTPSCSSWAQPASDPPRAVLMADAYVGWATSLERFGNSLPVPDSNRSWRVDVIVKQVGWLGQFRRSRNTGLWFAGGHLLHSLAHS